MSQETRKDPRAKVLSMTVRYKSATLDEFIEHHSYDVSRGGMYIKTPKPFPPGTLLKFEVRIAENQRVMQGVGRVVWKRNLTEADEGHPAGMGVKFIKLDDDSKALIDQLVSRRRDEDSEFERGDEITPAAGVAALRAQESERGKNTGRASIPVVDTVRGDQSADGTFFPSTDSDTGGPPREDRTMLKQAAELLQDALREAGGSVEELGTGSGQPSPPTRQSETAQTRPRPSPGGSGAEVSFKTESTPPRRQRRESDGRGLVERASLPASTRPEKPASVPARRGTSTPAAAHSAPSGGGGTGKLLLLVVGVAAAIAVVFYVTRKTKPVAPPEPAAPSAAAVPTPEPPPVASVPASEASAAPIAVDAGAVKDEADAAAAVEAVQVPDASVVPEPTPASPESEAPRVRVTAPRVRRTPAPTAPSPAEAEAPTPEPEPEAPASTTEEPSSPVAPAPAATTPPSSAPTTPSPAPEAPVTPPAVPAVPPSPPSPPASDNPYE